MRIVKQCAYCGHVYNLLPAVLVTPLYRLVNPPEWWAGRNPALPRTDWFARQYNSGGLEAGGFRLALKFWRWHLGWEVTRG